MSRRNRMMDYLMSRDGRNPYGSRGGYISSRDPRDRASYDRNNYEEDGRQGVKGTGRYGMGGSRYDRNSGYGEDYARGNRDYAGERQYDGHHYPFMVEGEFGMYDYPRVNPYEYEMMMDYARGGRGSRGSRDRASYDYDSGDYLSDEELYRWAEKLKQETDEKGKAFFSKENIKKKAEEMGIKFDKFTFEEFYVAVLMVYTDYCKTIGNANMNIYLALAKDWLCDEDVDVKYGEKLATYYDYVVDAK